MPAFSVEDQTLDLTVEVREADSDDHDVGLVIIERDGDELVLSRDEWNVVRDAVDAADSFDRYQENRER